MSEHHMGERGITLYHGGHMLVIARRAYERSHRAATEAEVSIIFSAIAVEAFMNEIADSARYHADTSEAIALAEILSEAEEANIRPQFKLRLALFALTGQLPPRDDALMEDFAALMSLRNALVHMKPQKVRWAAGEDLAGGNPKDLPRPIRHLIRNKVIQLPGKRTYAWKHLVTTPEVARWAYNVAVRAMVDLATAVPAGQFKQVIDFHVNGLNEVPPSE